VLFTKKPAPLSFRSRLYLLTTRPGPLSFRSRLYLFTKKPASLSFRSRPYLFTKKPAPLSFRSRPYRRGICFAAGSETTDSSRDNPALRNDNFYWGFQIGMTILTRDFKKGISEK
jgi:hypothetical protein